MTAPGGMRQCCAWRRFAALWFLGLVVCLGAGRLCHADDEASRISANPTFAEGLTGWNPSGDVRLRADTADSAQSEVVIGPGAGSIAQSIPVNGANHMMVSATLHADPAGVATLSIRCLDKDGRVLMTLHSPADIRPGKKPDTLEEYFRPHPLTARVEIAIEKTGTAGTAGVSRAELDLYHDDDPALQSHQNTAELMRPFWEGQLVSGEAVLLTSRAGRAAMGTLMFEPSRILSVTSYDGATQYRQGTDYTAQGRTLMAAAGSEIRQVRDTDLQQGELAWNVIGGKQVLVTYEHNDTWTGPVQPYVGDELPNTVRILRERGPLRIIAYGDSITYGIGSSHIQKLLPYQPPWVNLFADQLRTAWNDPAITLLNASQSGADSNWARRMAGQMVASPDPDLVVIAFGQNDFWSVPAGAFVANLTAVMETVRQTNPHAEFLLVATMRFDPAYSANPLHWDTVSAYERSLQGMTGPGVQLVDMTAISGAVFAAKAPRDCLNDPLHPNDYLSRWYAQSLLAALHPQPPRGETSSVAKKP